MSLVLHVLLGTCASMFADKECTEGKWYDVGCHDGSDGRYAENRVRDLERERRRLREKLDTLERVGRNY